MTAKSMKNRPSYEGRRAINQHLYHHHGKVRASGDLYDRLSAHDELHAIASQRNESPGHRHAPYQEGETDNEMARRLLADGIAAQPSSE